MIAREASPRFTLCLVLDEHGDTAWRRCVRSIIGQTYPGWELVVVAGPDNAGLVRSVAGDEHDNSRVRVLAGPDAGLPVEAMNLALGAATGDFAMMIEPTDWLVSDALRLIADALDQHPCVDYLYTDERIHDAGGERDFLKPDWSPERQRAQDYCGRASVCRRSIVEAVGGLRPELLGAEHHDLVLRVTERAREILHVPVVLVHHTGAPPSDDAEAGRVRAAAVSEHLGRVGIAADVDAGAGSGTLRVRRRLPDPPPAVSVVMPTVGTSRPVWGVQRPLVLEALRSLLATTAYPAMEVVVVVDPATPQPVVDDIAALDVEIVEGESPFNFAERCNLGVAASTGEYVVLLNDDTLVEQPDWLSVMIGFFGEPDVGVVGARLLYADGTLQHGGILLNEQPLHIFHGFAGDDPGPFDLLRVDREVSVVTGACLATPRALWDELGGLSTDFAVAFNDLDYCLRVRRRGGRVIWTPHATLYHFESQTRRPDAAQHEIDLLYARWGRELHHDPYGNPNFEPRQAVWVERQGRTIEQRIWSVVRRILRRSGVHE